MFGLFQAFITFTIIEIAIHSSIIRRQVLVELEALRGATEDIMELTIGVETTDNLVLRRHIELFHHFVKFLAQFNIFTVKISDLAILLRQEEFEILYLVLRLAAL